MSLNATIARVTERIVQRSIPVRRPYLDRMARARDEGPHRAHLACGNQAHAYAAMTAGDKEALVRETAGNLGIVTAYNDMLSAHQPFETYPALIRHTLLRNRAEAAHFIALHEPLIGSLEERVAAVLPIDVLVLGMGADMHTASLFPGAPELDAALAEDAPALMKIHAPGQPETRLTLTAPTLRAASVIHILIVGTDKLEALETALAGGPATEAPVRAALTAPCPVTVHYAA